MTSPLLNLSDPNLPSAIAANFTEEMACFGRELPGAELHEDEELLWFAVSPTLNGVLRSRFRSDDQAYITRRIEAITQYYMKRNATSFSWTINQLSRPADLEQHLRTHGFTLAHTSTIMTLAIAARIRELPTCPNLEIREVSNETELKLMCEIERIGFITPTSSIQRYYDMYLRSGFGPGHAWRHFLGYRQGRAVASTSLHLYAGVAGIYGVATLPEARRRGVAASMMLHVLDKAEELGYRIATLSPTDQSQRLYQRIGFCITSQSLHYRRSLHE